MAAAQSMTPAGALPCMTEANAVSLAGGIEFIPCISVAEWPGTFRAVGAGQII